MKLKQSPKSFVGAFDPSPKWTGWATIEVWHDIVPSWYDFSFANVHAKVVHCGCAGTDNVFSAVDEAMSGIDAHTVRENYASYAIYIEDLPPSHGMGNRYLQQAGVYWILMWECKDRDVLPINNMAVKKYFGIPHQLARPKKKQLMVEAVRSKLNDPRFNRIIDSYTTQDPQQGICDAVATGIAGYYQGVEEGYLAMEESLD